ncbi:MAG TPA: DNA internalization-related competence protein ComEC/Rec2 [Gaiella sp.]|uniref:DNA internalization-related competence protein ComEC/Rec2 n=1 Tax=Gaiella sp. TaxID=2663207 RepID=UPI002D80564A|nr:DNA internalization-related competence protein ComEC/Rec2 [Gaiella sp.]HET9289218.1 DNA internalization-related competence protein ComEC/Rec2 [Gaiella sp.]
MRRFLETGWPTLLVGAACVGVAVSVWVRPPAPALALAAVVALAGALLESDTRRLVLAGVALACIGLWWGSVRGDALERSYLVGRLGQEASARVVVTGPARRTPFALRAPAEVRRFGPVSIRERVLLELPPERAPPQGAILELRAQPVAPRGPETGFDERGWLARRGVHVVLRGEDARVVGRRGGIGGVGDRLRAHVESTLARGTSGERRRLLVGIVLGEDAEIGSELENAFEASGLMHLLAVSGQNIGIVAIGVVTVARVVGVGRLVGEAVAIVIVLAYALAVGWQPSVVRAAVAGSLASLAWIAARPRDRWHALAVGALVLLAWMPQSALEPGFQLSFAAVAAIFLVLPRVAGVPEAYPIPRRLWDVLVVAVACGLVTAPVVWLHFGRVALWTVPANVAAEPAMPPLISLSLAAAAIEPVLPGAAVALAWLAGWCAAWIAFVARGVAGWPSAQVESPVVIAAAAALLGAVVLLRRLPRHRRRSTAAALVSAALTLAAAACAFRPLPSWEPPSGLRVTFLDVGQGDSVLLEVPGGAVLFDQGPPEANVAGQLHGLGLRSLTAIVLTHPQRDHIGGAADVLARLRVGAVADPALEAPSSDHDAVISAARRDRVPVVVARAGDVFRIGRLRLRILWPDEPGLASDDPNQHAVVAVASYGRTDVLLTADAESDVTSRLPLRAVEVLKVAHHGSEDAGLPDLLRTLRPRLAVISVGEGNSFDHPRPETVAALAAVPGMRSLRTDLNGRIVVESDGRALTVRSER